ncbi:glycoside hydrolase family 113 [Phytoactinopolyspora halotolerans]|uniref:1,4-beta-xylanase n=1 Tax=Phytoactinopolyspora halotolerans TaxID=1981512 RepID=A0A6L9S7G4_9ACTN|nr:1,4-beta-xylanase [Phytoactinopolyspora halotolerans]
MTWGWTGVRGTWATPQAEQSLRELAAVGGVTWVTIAFAALQETAHSTRIPFTEPPTVTDDELRWAIRRARELGLRVCLKPTVNCADGTWRAFIAFFDQDVPGEPSWTEWFASYREFILHYARIAQQEDCELLCIGCEMVQADRQERHWRELIADVRRVYDGLVTYNCDKYQEDRLTWWDAVDVITSSGYYPSGTWTEHLDRIEGVVERWGKPFFFMEAGCPSREGSAARPNDWTLAGAASPAEQERYYREMFEACTGRPWMQGFMLWDWPPRLYAIDEAAHNDDYCVYAKPAQDVVGEHYRALARRSTDHRTAQARE